MEPIQGRKRGWDRIGLIGSDGIYRMERGLGLSRKDKGTLFGRGGCGIGGKDEWEMGARWRWIDIGVEKGDLVFLGNECVCSVLRGM